jgi:uncharacterized protein DUF1963
MRGSRTVFGLVALLAVAAPTPASPSPRRSTGDDQGSPKKRLIHYRAVKKPITTPTTKLGGLPSWLGKPQWPIGTDGKPMLFIGQVELRYVLPHAGHALAYLFYMDDPGARHYDFGGPDAAVIIQPGGTYSGPTRPLRAGPTLYRRSSRTGVESRTPVELALDLEEVDEAPAGTWDHVGPDNVKRYLAYQEARREDKIGGHPVLSDNPPMTSLPVGMDWRLLIQLNDRDWEDIFFLNFAGDATSWVMVSPDGREGRIFSSR